MKLEMKFHPAADSPRKAWLTAIFLGFMAGALLYVFPYPLITALMVFMMVYNLLPFYFPTYYKLDDQAITMSRLGKDYVYPWDNYRSYTIQQNGIVLWPETSVPQRNDGVKKQMSALRRSVFFPMTPKMISDAESLLRQKLVLTKQQ